MATQDLFKQAIADAKSIREAAIANAKLALEESITPELKELLAAKLQEMEEDADEEVEETYNKEVEEEVEEVVAEEEADEEAEDDSEESEDEAEEEEAEGEEPAGDEEVADSDLTVDDLKDMIRDIISQEMGEEGAEIGSEEGAEDMMDVGAEELPMEDEEEIDINELLAELSEELDEEFNDNDKQGNQDDLDIDEEVKEEEAEIKERTYFDPYDELKEALAQVEELKAQLQETNLLNAKLLYVNKVFKGNNLTESQKANVIATFDKAETVKEVKLVFETVAESFTTKKAVVKESRGFASAAVGNAPSKPEVITEVSSQVRRMQQLAGIIK